MVGARGIRSEKMRDNWYRKEYARYLEGKRVGDEYNNVEHMWEQVKRKMVERAREVCGPVRVVRKNPKSVWWNDEVKAAVRRIEAVWKGVLAASDEEVKKEDE